MPLFPVIQIFTLTAMAFIFTMAWTPLFTNFLYKHRLCKNIRDATSAPIFAKLHAKKAGTPTMGGVLVWVTTLIFATAFFYFEAWTNIPLLSDLNFLSRSQTWLPLGALVATALVGLVDDFFNIRRLGPKGGGLTIKHRLLIYT